MLYIMNIDLVGYVGSVLLGITLIPQVVTTYKGKNAENISAVYLILQMTSCVCFIVYSYVLHSLPIIICNGLVLLFSTSLLVAKYKFKNNNYLEIA